MFNRKKTGWVKYKKVGEPINWVGQTLNWVGQCPAGPSVALALFYIPSCYLLAYVSAHFESGTIKF